MKVTCSRLVALLCLFAKKLYARAAGVVSNPAVRTKSLAAALVVRGVATSLAVFCCMEAHAARVYFNVGYQASNGATYTTSTNSIQINALLAGTSLSFTSADPTAATFSGSGNDVSGVLSYITPTGSTVSTSGTISRRESSGSNVRAFYFVAAAASANNAYLLPVTTTTAQNYFANLAKPANVGTNSAGVRTALEQYRVDQGNLPLITVNNVSVTEGSVSPLYAVFRVSLNVAANGNVTFSPVIAGVSATVASTSNPAVGDDVYALSTLEYSFNGTTWSTVPTSVTIPQGSLYVDCRIQIVNDLVVEPVETFTLRTGTLSQPANVQNNGGAFGVGTITDDDVANVAPTVSLTQPANNSVFTAPGVIALQATAADSDGSVSKVEFFNGAMLLGEDLVPPYQFSWSNVAAGSYTVTAKATDNFGATTISSPLALIVNAPPSVTLTAPANNSVGIAPASFTLTANATDSDGTIAVVDFYNGDTKIGTSTTTPYQFVWNNVAVGNYSLTAVATDNQGAATASAAAAVRVDPANLPPTATLTNPTNGSVFPAPGNFTLTASAADSDGSVVKVEFYRGGTFLGESLTAPYQLAISSLGAGTYSFTAKSTDNSGATTTSGAVSVIVNALPTAALTSPANGASATAPANFSLAATASDSDGTIVKVEFFNGNTKLGTNVTAPFTSAWNNVPEGSYILTAVATDDRGATATSGTVMVEVTPHVNVAPEVELTAPAANALFLPPATVSLAATASDSDGTVAKVEFFEGANKLGESLSAPFAYSWIGVSSGHYILTAKATDNLGLETTSASVAIDVNALPVANPESVATAVNTPVAITLTGSDLESSPASLTFEILTQPTHGVLTGTAPNLSYSPTTGFEGTDSFTFRVADNFSASAPATVTMIVASPNSPPTVDAGPDELIGYMGNGANQVLLRAAATDDGRPNPPAALSYLWTQTGGPQPAQIDSTDSLETRVHFGPITPGYGRRFVTADDSILLTTSMKYRGTTAFSWEMWFRSDAVPASWQTMICAADTISDQDIYLGFGGPATAANNIAFVVDGSNGTDNSPISYSPPGGFAVGVWYHVVATHDYVNQRTRLYVNGVLRANKTSSATPLSRPMPLSFGRWWDGGNLFNHFLGSLDEVRIYERELTPDEALAHYAKGLGYPGTPETGLVGGWHLDDTSGLMNDYSGASLYGTLTGAPAAVEGIVNGTSSVSAAGVYTFRLTADDGALAASDEVQVTVNTPPQVHAGENQNVRELGQGAILTGSVSDDGVPYGAPTVSWSQVDGPGVAIFSQPSTATTAVSFSAPGIYQLKLSGSDGLVTASDVVEVRIGIFSVEPPAGLAAWWPANGDFREVVHGGHDLEIVPNGVNYGAGKVSQAFLFNGSNDRGRVAAHSDLDVGQSADGMTIELWVKPTVAEQHAPLVRWQSDSGQSGVHLFHYIGTPTLFASLTDSTGLEHHIHASGIFSAGTWVHVALTYDRVTGVARLYCNGVIVSEQSLGIFTPQTSYPMNIGGPSASFNGALDEISLYTRPLTHAEVQAIFAAGIAGKSPPDDNTPPIVNAGPDVVVASALGTATLSGTVADDGLPSGGQITNEWKKVDGPGEVIFANKNSPATTATFEIPGIYILRLDADDGLNAAAGDTMAVHVGVATVEPPQGLVAWWPANGELHEVVRGGHDITFAANGARYGAGKVSQAFLFNGGTERGRIAAHSDLDIGQSAAGMTIELWVKPGVSGQHKPLLQWRSDSNQVGVYLYHYNGDQTLFASITDTNGVEHHIYTLGVFNAGVWLHAALTYDRVTGIARLYCNGSLASVQNLGIFTPQTSYPLDLGGLSSFNGALDEISLYNRPLAQAEIQAVYNAGTAGKGVVNTPPVASVGPDLSAIAGVPLSIAGTASDDGFPNPPALVTYLWTKISGPGTAIFSAATSAATTVTFDVAGTYTLRLTASDSSLTGSDDLSVMVAASQPPAVALTSPANNAAVAANTAVTLTATASDPDGTVTLVEFFDGATKLGEDIVAPYSLSIPAGFAVGSHMLTAKATDNHGIVATSAPVTITSAIPPSTPPTIAIFEPGSSLGIGVYFEIAANVTDSDGTIAKVEFFQGATKLGEQIFPELGEPTVYFWPMNGGLPAGTYTFTAKATDNSGASTTSAPITVEVSANGGSVNDVFIATPDDDSRISAPTSITGVIAPTGLTSWTLQYRLRPPGDDTAASLEPWLTAVTGSAAVGTAATSSSPAAPGVIGTFDPTTLINGLYEIRVVANSSTSTITTAITGLIVEGNMKVGAFSLAFEDLKLPLAGLPITITRTYDSRDTRVGDFGPGWRLALANVRVQKNRHLGTTWYQTEGPENPPAFFPFFVTPQRERIVTVTMPDGETHRFRAGAFVRNTDFGNPADNQSVSVPASEGKLRFYPLGDTTSKLEPLNSSNQLVDDIFIYGTGYQDLMTGDQGDFDAVVYNATRFRLTTKDGSVFILDETLGLLSLSDLSGNTLVLNRDGANHVTGVTSTQNAPGGPITQSVTIHRDATGRVDYIRDPDNRDLDYGYDAQGRLAAFMNREDDLTQFLYENASFPYYLTKIIDPRGITALRSEFDAAGRLIKQIDADGKETIFNRGIDANGRFEKIKDRLQKETTFYYDDRGNITLKIDPLGAQTSFSYYPDSDWVKFETDHYGNVKATARDARGNVTVETTGASIAEDPANPTTGHITRMEYNSLSAPTKITDPSGRVQTFTYDPLTNNLLTHTVGFGGTSPATTTYTYNADGTPATITDALGNVTSYTYNYSFSDAAYPGAVKQITVTVTDPAGATGSDPTNASATILRSTRTLSDAQENQLAQIATRTLPNSSTEEVVTRYRYDSENRLVATIMPDGRVTETRYTAFGKEEKSVLWRTLADYETHNDADARVTSFTYDDRGNLVTTVHPDGTSETTRFDEENRRDWSQDRRGNITYFTYDDAGRLITTTLPDATPGDLTDNPKTQTVYDLIGRVTDTYDELNHRTQTVYYPDGTPDAMRRQQLVQVRAAGNLVTSYVYDASGNVRFVTDPRGNTTETIYDDQGRPQFVIYPATDEHPATQTETRYDILGRRVATVDQEGKITRSRYDGLGRLFEVRQYIDQSLAASDATFTLASSTTGLAVTRYSFDELGNQRTQTDSLGRVTSYHTDSLGRRTQRVLPKDTGEGSFLTEQLQYDAWGNLWKRTDFAGKTTTFTYDALNRLKTKVADPTHPSLGYSHATARVEYDYDAAGMRSAARTYNAGNTLLYTETTPHDDRGRLELKASTAGQLGYSYYANGLLKDTVSASIGGGLNVGYRYDELNRLEFVDDVSTGLPTRTTGYTYNANGSLETMTQANAVTHTYSYDALNRLRTLNVARGATLLHAYEYKLNAAGHRREVIEGAKTTTYTYDGVYRLTNESITADPHANNGAIGYGLDKVGNRLSRSSSVATIQNQIGSFNARDWLASDTYTANGSTIQGATALSPVGSTTDTYDFEERLILRTRTDGTSLNISYDADGNRVQKTIFDAFAAPVSSTAWLVDRNNLTGYAQVVEERFSQISSPASEITRIYTYGSGLISVGRVIPNEPSSVRYYGLDGHNNVRELTNEIGTVTDRYDYDAFGNLVFHSGTSDNAYLYCGEQFDANLGLYFLRARYLNPDSGRFWSQDNYEGNKGEPTSLHKYLYANANPIGHYDPSGRFSIAEISVAAGIGATLNVALAIPNIYRNWDTLSVEDIAKKLGTEALSGAVTGVVGGIGGKIFLKTVAPGVKWLFAQAVIEGAAGGGLEQVAKELWGVLQGKPVTISSGGRIFVATLVGALGGGATFKIKPFIEPTVKKVLNPIFENADGFLVRIPWIEVTKETVSWPGVGGAMAAKAVTDWIQDGVEMMGGFDN